MNTSGKRERPIRHANDHCLPQKPHPISLRGLFTRVAGVLAAGYLFYRVAWIVIRERQTDVLATATTLPIPDYGTVGAVGHLLFTDFLFPFEAI